MADFSSLTFHIFTGKKIGGFLIELLQNIFEDYYSFDLFLATLAQKLCKNDLKIEKLLFQHHLNIKKGKQSYNAKYD
jgi:hypothetical protein